jgi:RNA polymerase sigma-70 factor (ECF subfamily)
LRRQRRHLHETFDEAVGTEGNEPATQETAREVRANEIDRRVQRAMAVLSPTQRAVFALRRYEGLALADIAESLGCTVGSVKVHLFRALKKMQRELVDLQ